MANEKEKDRDEIKHLECVHVHISIHLNLIWMESTGVATFISSVSKIRAHTHTRVYKLEKNKPNGLLRVRVRERKSEAV